MNENVSLFMMRLAGAPQARMTMRSLGQLADSPVLGALMEERRQAVERQDCGTSCASASKKGLSTH